MRIVVWNINGLRTLRGYQPWYRLPDWQACLAHLDADIACFQETKLTRKQLQEWMCILPDYHAFFNLHPTKGYSGTVTYVKKDKCIPLKAEQGITGRLSDVDNASLAIGGYPRDVDLDVEPAIWNGLDAEGRAVVLDCGLFVLFNLYCPNETGPERLEYKMSYYHCLEERANKLIQQGRQVMIVGDMNIIRDPIDHCDPEQSLKEHGWNHFHEHPARAWFSSFLAPKGKFHDVGRIYHPKRTKMFTNWNTLIDARPANYGVRLDYTLVTEGLLPWIKGADIQPDVYGSDHCPIYVDMHDSREIDGKTVHLKDLMNGGSGRPPPPLAACFYDEFSGKQRKLASFFGAGAANKNKAEKVSTSDALALPREANAGSAAAGIVNGRGGMRTADQQIGTSSGTSSGSPSQASTSGLATTSSGAQDTADIEVVSITRASQTAATANPITSSPGKQSSSKSAVARSSPPKRAAGPSSSSSSTSSSSTASKKAAAASTMSKSSKGGQMRLQSFFTKPKPAIPTTDEVGPSSTPPSSSATIATVAPAIVPSQGAQFNSSQDGGRSDSEDIEAFDERPSDHSGGGGHARTASSTSSTSSSTAAGRGIEAALDGATADGEPSATERVEASLAWGAIFAPLPPPSCRSHGEPAKAWKVNKPGPNHNRKFWLCARPVGPGYEKSGRAKGDVNPEYRCNFFMWDSDWKVEVQRKRSRTGAGTGAGGGTEEQTSQGRSFAEVGREKRVRSSARAGEWEDGGIGGDDGAPHKRVRSTT